MVFEGLIEGVFGAALEQIEQNSSPERFFGGGFEMNGTEGEGMEAILNLEFPSLEDLENFLLNSKFDIEIYQIIFLVGGGVLVILKIKGGKPTEH